MTERAVVREQLDRSLSTVSLFALSFGTIIGVGWITVLGSWLSDAGALGAIIAFVVGGLIMLPIALCYAEIAGMYPVSGGEVAYVYQIYGERMSFMAGWLLAYMYIAVTSFEAVAVGWVLSAMFPGIEGPVIYSFLGSDVTLWTLLIGIGLTALIAAINFFGAKSTSSFQLLFVGILVLASLVFVVAGLSRAEPEYLQPLFVGDTFNAATIGVLAVVATTPFWFGGFDTIPQAMGEVSKDVDLGKIARVMVGSILISLIFYVAIILTASVSVERTTLLGFDLPIAGAAGAVFDGGFMRQVVLFAGLCGLLTTWNAMFYAGTRVMFSLGRARMIPHGFAHIHPVHGSPSRAVIFVGVVGGLGALMGRQAIDLISGSSALVFALLFALVTFGVLRLRDSQPDHPRPYRFPGGKPGLWLASAFSGLVLLIAAVAPLLSSGGAIPTEWLLLAGWALLGLIFYVAAKPMRAEISAEEQRYLILNED
ncbi:MAG: APC family permease [Pseudomonadota bacterium]